MGTFSRTRTTRLRKRLAAIWLSVVAVISVISGGATAAQAGESAAGWGGAPWHSVGPGWILAELAKSQSSSGQGTLYLVSPGGQRYRLGPAPANAILEDWSGNGTDALFFPEYPGPTSAPITVLNLHTGQASSFTVSSNEPFPDIAFSRPEGTAILFQPGATSSGASLPLERFSLAGALELSYPTQFAQAGAFAGSFRENASGTELVLNTQNGLEVMSNNGQPIRAILTRGPADSCSLLNWWSNEALLVDCSGQLLIYPLSGGRAEQLTGPGDTAAFLGAWHIPSGTYAEAAACGTTWLEKLNSNDTATRLTIPGATDAGTVQPLGTYGNQLPLLIGGGCDGHYPYSFVDWYQPSTNVARTVVGGPAGGGYVTGAVLFRAAGQPSTGSF